MLVPSRVDFDMGVSKNRGTPKSSILIGFFIINHPFWGTPIFGNTHILLVSPHSADLRNRTIEVSHFSYRTLIKTSLISKHVSNKTHI